MTTHRHLGADKVRDIAGPSRHQHHPPRRRAPLETRLRTIYADRRDKTMYVIGAGTLRYKLIVEVIDAAKGAGVERVGIVTEKMRQSAS